MQKIKIILDRQSINIFKKDEENGLYFNIYNGKFQNYNFSIGGEYDRVEIGNLNITLSESESSLKIIVSPFRFTFYKGKEVFDRPTVEQGNMTKNKNNIKYKLVDNQFIITADVSSLGTNLGISL
jgi:hypothetical protein